VLKQTALILDEENVNPNYVTFEFTESAYFESEEKTKGVLRLLREAGIQVAVDDFGTGCASFLYLKERYFDVLKIDKEFITNIESDSSNFAIVSALVGLAKDVGLEVVAEGVETHQELDVLVSMGVEYIQGYYFSKPKSMEALKTEENYCAWPTQTQVEELVGDTVKSIASATPYHLDPSDHLSIIYEYSKDESVHFFPVLDGKKCVGVVDRSTMNLHLTPSMGTDLETSREHATWNKTANRMMDTDLVELYWMTPVAQIDELMKEQQAFPWILIDEHENFKGLITMSDLLQYLLDQRR
jgi:CBS domain-containing protein